MVPAPRLWIPYPVWIQLLEPQYEAALFHREHHPSTHAFVSLLKRLCSDGCKTSARSMFPPPQFTELYLKSFLTYITFLHWIVSIILNYLIQPVPSLLLFFTRVGSSVKVKDFKSSWRSGVAFHAILCSLRPDLVDMSLTGTRSSLENLKEAFCIAQQELGIPRLLEPEGGCNFFKICQLVYFYSSHVQLIIAFFGKLTVKRYELTHNLAKENI